MYTINVTPGGCRIDFIGDTHADGAVAYGSETFSLTVPDRLARTLTISDTFDILYTGDTIEELDYVDDALRTLYSDYLYSTLILYPSDSYEYYIYGSYRIRASFGSVTDTEIGYTDTAYLTDYRSTTAMTSGRTLLTGYSLESIVLGFVLVVMALSTLFNFKR